MQGDCELVARVPAMTSTNALAKADLMIRETLAAESTFGMIFFHGDRRINFYHRDASGAQTAGVGGSSAGQPYQWLKISRAGNVFTGDYSLDGLSWKQLGTCTIPMGQTVYVGMATAGAATNAPVSADWDHIGFTNLPRVTVVPSSALASFTPSALDLDDDNLPDAWENANGINSGTRANGMGQYGDPDGDHVSNYDEYLLNSNPLSNGNIAGNLTRELWPSLKGDTFHDVVTSMAFLQGSTQISLLPTSEQLTLGNTGGTQRVRGLVTAPVTGGYRFWISGYSDCELWLNDIGAPKFGKRKIAWLYEKDPGGAHLVDFREWNSYPTQASAPIHFVAGQRYFIEVLQKQSQGSGHFSVA